MAGKKTFDHGGLFTLLKAVLGLNNSSRVKWKMFEFKFEGEGEWEGERERENRIVVFSNKALLVLNTLCAQVTL